SVLSRRSRPDSAVKAAVDIVQRIGDRPTLFPRSSEGQQMSGFALVCSLALVVTSGPVETKFAQVAPASATPGVVVRSEDRTRAVVLVTGLCLHLIRESEVLHARFSSWQKPGSPLVSLLAADADVFSFAYAQSVPITEIACLPDFIEAIEQLRSAGYA